MSYDCGEDIKQRPIPPEDKKWRSAGGYASSKYVLGTSGEFPAEGDVRGHFKEYEPRDPNCGTASGTFKEWSPRDPNCGPEGGTAGSLTPRDPNRD